MLLSIAYFHPSCPKANLHYASQDFYKLFRNKVVDIALQGGNFQVIGDLNLDTQDACESNIGEWIERWKGSHCVKREISPLQRTQRLRDPLNL